jgi:predicted ATPase
MVKEASATHGKQVFIATHSPVLLSQFAREDLVEMSSIQGRTRVRRVSEIHEADDLLQEYAVGSLYMAEAIGRQSAEPKAES